MTTTPTPTERVVHAYDADPNAATRQRVAATHQPEDDAEADRIAAIGATVPLSTVQRVAIGYQAGQRAAAAAATARTTTTEES